MGGQPSDIFNLGQGRGFSVKEVIEQAAGITGKKIPIIDTDRREGDPPVLIASNTKARQQLGWQPAFSNLEDIIQTAWRWHQTT